MALLCKIPIGLAAALDDAGISRAEIVAAAGLPSLSWDATGQRIPVTDYFAVWRAIREVSDDPGIGLRLAQMVKADFTEPLFLAILSAADVTSSLEILSSYKRLLSPDAVTVRFGQQLEVTYEWPDVGVPV